MGGFVFGLPSLMPSTVKKLVQGCNKDNKCCKNTYLHKHIEYGRGEDAKRMFLFLKFHSVPPAHLTMRRQSVTQSIGVAGGVLSFQVIVTGNT